MKLLPLALLLASLSTASFGEGLGKFIPAGVESGTGLKASSASCHLENKSFPADAQVIGLTAYSGKDLPFQIDQSGHGAGQMDVAVHTDKPVILLVSAYEPTVWNIGWSKGTKIVGVYATGYHRQAVAGLPKGVPVVTAGFDAGRAGGCDGSYLQLTDMNAVSVKELGMKVTRVYTKNSRDEYFSVKESNRDMGDLMTSTDHPPGAFKDAKAPLSGQPGLDAAVKAGLIRAVGPADKDMVRKAFLAKAKGTPAYEDIPDVAGMSKDDVYLARALPQVEGYVVLKAFTYPAGLYGAHLSHFVIPKGVPTPTGDPGHSTVIDLNKVMCSGAMCSR